MKRWRIAVYAIGILILSAAVASGAEFRGLWVDAFHPGFKTPAQTTAMVARAKECGFNAVVVQVRRRGDVYYKSAIEPMATDVAPGYDPLADIVKQAHAAGLEAHAWIAVYEVSHDVPYIKPDPAKVHLAHPNWLMKDEHGKSKFPGEKLYLDPGVPEVREYLAGIIGEIAEKYEVDGVHLDLVKYSGPQSGYNDLSVSRFNEETKSQGKPKSTDKAWGDWRRAQVTEFVRLAKERLSQSRQRAKLSAAVSGSRYHAYENCLQDWVGWLKSGLLDFAVPMVFAMDDRVFQSTMADALKAGGSDKIYVGQGGWQLSAAQSVQQIRKAREAGAKGIVIYSYAYCKDRRKGDATSLMDALKAGLFARPDTVSAMPRERNAS